MEKGTRRVVCLSRASLMMSKSSMPEEPELISHVINVRIFLKRTEGDGGRG